MDVSCVDCRYLMTPYTFFKNRKQSTTYCRVYANIDFYFKEEKITPELEVQEFSNPGTPSTPVTPATPSTPASESGDGSGVTYVVYILH